MKPTQTAKGIIRVEFGPTKSNLLMLAVAFMLAGMMTLGAILVINF